MEVRGAEPPKAPHRGEEMTDAEAAAACGCSPPVQMRKFQTRNQTQQSPRVTLAAKQTEEMLCFCKVGPTGSDGDILHVFEDEHYH